jgi:hypothetical protein
MLKSALTASAILAMGCVGFAQAENADHTPSGQIDSSNSNRDHNKHDPIAAPEIDPASAISALTLLFGGLAVIRGRRTK